MTCHWFCNKRILRFHLKKYFKSHSVRYWEPDWLIRFTIVFQLNNGKNIWSSLKRQWQLPHLTNDCIVWPWSAKQLDGNKNLFYAWQKVNRLRTCDLTLRLRCQSCVWLRRLIWVFAGRTYDLSLVMRKPGFALCPMNPRSLISTFVVRCLDSITPLVVVFEISRV